MILIRRHLSVLRRHLDHEGDWWRVKSSGGGFALKGDEGERRRTGKKRSDFWPPKSLFQNKDRTSRVSVKRPVMN